MCCLQQIPYSVLQPTHSHCYGPLAPITERHCTMSSSMSVLFTFQECKTQVITICQVKTQQSPFDFYAPEAHYYNFGGAHCSTRKQKRQRNGLFSSFYLKQKTIVEQMCTMEHSRTDTGAYDICQRQQVLCKRL